jgi:hypothetical protein
MATLRAADVAKQRLSLAARRLGTRDPTEVLGPFLDRAFDLPLGDRRYGSNALLPGSLPLEHSFSEVAPSTLRFDFEPFGPGTNPMTRRQECSREMRRVVNACFGRGALSWFDEKSEAFRGGQVSGRARFGAWFGAGFDENGINEAKVYYELEPGQLGDLPPNLQHAAQVAMACLPGLTPIFTSIACGRTHGGHRIYLYHRGELRLLDLEPLMNRLGVGQQLPSVLSAIGLVLGGRFVLPDGSVIIGLRDTSRGIEMKLDILLPYVPDPPQEMQDLIQMHLAQRPESQRAYRQWTQAMTPDGYGGPGRMSVMSVRVRPNLGSRLTVYFRPVGYDQPPTRSGRPGQLSGGLAGAPEARRELVMR